jgi:nitroimidazol reductase NimA-like FMN-containing flavoprotein (pyridoxamine 5'-phosphate oxidase superfamily)
LLPEHIAQWKSYAIIHRLEINIAVEIMVSSLTEVQARNLLETGTIGRLGCIVEGEPYVVPISYIAEGNSIYSHSLSGTKINALRENPRACFQVDKIQSALRWSSVLAFGTFEELSDHEERHRVINKLLYRFPLLTPVESTLALDAESAEVVVFRIKIERITGVAEGEKTELELLESLGSRTDDF